MNVQAWTFVMVGLSFALYIGVAIWSRAGSTSEFYVAGGQISPLTNGLATLFKKIWQIYGARFCR